MVSKKDEKDEELAKLLDEVLLPDNGLTEQTCNWSSIERFAKVVPLRVPPLLECTPTEFMELPPEHFTQLCEKHTYSKVVSSLTYIQNIAGHGDQTVIERVESLKAALKAHKTSPAPESHSTPSLPIEDAPSSENPASS